MKKLTHSSIVKQLTDIPKIAKPTHTFSLVSSPKLMITK